MEFQSMVHFVHFHCPREPLLPYLTKSHSKASAHTSEFDLGDVFFVLPSDFITYGSKLDFGPVRSSREETQN